MYHLCSNNLSLRDSLELLDSEVAPFGPLQIPEKAAPSSVGTRIQNHCQFSETWGICPTSVKAGTEAVWVARAPAAHTLPLPRSSAIVDGLNSSFHPTTPLLMCHIS